MIAATSRPVATSVKVLRPRRDLPSEIERAIPAKMNAQSCVETRVVVTVCVTLVPLEPFGHTTIVVEDVTIAAAFSA
jgi:hypothetical protein